MRPQPAILILLVTCLLLLGSLSPFAEEPKPKPEPSPSWIVGTVPGVRTGEIELDLARLRGLKFTRQVPVDVKNAQQMREFIGESFEDDSDTLKTAAATYRIFGFIPPDMDLKATLVDAYSEGVAGFYLPSTKRFYVATEAHPPPRGVDAEIGKRIGLSEMALTTAHEMDHALQDMHFDLKSQQDKAKGFKSQDQALAMRSLIEGDATWVTHALMLDRMGVPAVTMPSMKSMAESPSRRPGARKEKMDKIPLAIRRQMLFPYVEGSSFVHHLRRLAPDWELVDKAYKDLPDSTQQILHPFLYVGKRRFPTDISFKTLPQELNGWTVTDEDTNGEFLSGLLLDCLQGEKLDHRRMVGAWVGDRYRVYQKEERAALVWFSTWSSEAAAREIEATLKAGYARPEFKPVPLKIERKGSDILVVRGLQPDEMAPFVSGGWDVERVVRSHPVLIELSDEELVKRQELASRLKPDQEKLKRIYEGLPTDTKGRDFRLYGSKWHSVSLSVAIVPPLGWELSLAGVPELFDLGGDYQGQPRCRMLLKELEGSENISVEKLDQVITASLKSELPNLQMGSRREFMLKGLRAIEVQMTSTDRVRNRFLKVHSVVVRHRGKGLLFLFLGGGRSDLSGPQEELLKAVDFQ